MCLVINGFDISLSIFCSTSESEQSTKCKSTSTFADMPTNVGGGKKNRYG